MPILKVSADERRVGVCAHSALRPAALLRCVVLLIEPLLSRSVSCGWTGFRID